MKELRRNMFEFLGGSLENVKARAIGKLKSPPVYSAFGRLSEKKSGFINDYFEIASNAAIIFLILSPKPSMIVFDVTDQKVRELFSTPIGISSKIAFESCDHSFEFDAFVRKRIQSYDDLSRFRFMFADDQSEREFGKQIRRIFDSQKKTCYSILEGDMDLYSELSRGDKERITFVFGTGNNRFVCSSRYELERALNDDQSRYECNRDDDAMVIVNTSAGATVKMTQGEAKRMYGNNYQVIYSDLVNSPPYYDTLFHPITGPGGSRVWLSTDDIEDILMNSLFASRNDMHRGRAVQLVDGRTLNHMVSKEVLMGGTDALIGGAHCQGGTSIRTHRIPDGREISVLVP